MSSWGDSKSPTIPNWCLVLVIGVCLGWMLFRANPQEAYHHLFGVFRPGTKTIPGGSLDVTCTAMLKQAAAKHGSANGSRTSIKHAFKPACKPGSPLVTITGNTGNHLSVPHQNVLPKAGSKRTFSGLAKALPTHDGFDEPIYPTTNQAKDPLPKQQSHRAYLDGIYVDEQDFDDDDFDLETEQILPQNSLLYPPLPSSVANHDSGDRHSGHLPAGTPIPWSSSPTEHLQAQTTQALLKKYIHSPLSRPTAPNPESQANKASKLSKRRHLPWQTKQTDQTTDEASESSKAAKPASSHRIVNPSYSWNISASTLKSQQKSIREAHKKRVKTTEVQDLRADAIQIRKANRTYKIFLSDEQQTVLNMVVNKGKSIFFTGSAGTGKSVLLREIIAALRQKYRKEADRVAITASTGLAACNIGGITLHSFSGIGLGNSSVDDLVKKIKRNQKAKHRWMRTKVLIIDEVSMVDGDLYDKLEQIARQMKNNGKPFGGIQLVITGDFFQLPPVPEGGRQAKFAFNARTWNTTIGETVALHKVFRQKDPEFAAMLNQMREGRLDAKSIARFKALDRELAFDDDLEPTELFSTRVEVERANTARLAALHADGRIFEARDGGKITEREFRDKLLANVMAPERITLKKGAQVMLIKNYDETLVNGSLGKVIGFMSEPEFASYHDDEQAYLSTQAPPAMRSQAKTIVDLAGTGASSIFPVIRFAIADGTTRDLLCQREQWSVELPNGEVQASRSQIPLILAWALSIHKAQGQTLERVKVNLSKAFERGQAYVALSRATSMAGLQVIGFDPAKVMAHEAVRKFYSSLSRIETAKPREKTTDMPDAFPGLEPNSLKHLPGDMFHESDFESD